MGLHNQLGYRGEQLAVNYLTERGYTILKRNYRYLKAEIDILATKGDILAVVEVKSRRSQQFGSIAGTVNKKKIQLMVLAADRFIQGRGLELEVRFDIITVYFGGNEHKITHLKNAFYHF